MTTTLECLNHVLSVIGEDPVTSSDSTHPSVISTLTQVNRVNKELQSLGWWFNTEWNLKLIPNELGQIIIPSTTLYIELTNPRQKYVRRGGKLYDPINHTFIIDADVYVNLVLLLDIGDLPETAASYVMHKTAYDFYVSDDGDEAKSTRLEKETIRAWARLQSESLQVEAVNAQNRPLVANLLKRVRQRGNGYDPRYLGGKP